MPTRNRKEPLPPAVARDGYTSENSRRLTVEETKALLLTLPEVRSELADWRGGADKLRIAA